MTIIQKHDWTEVEKSIQIACNKLLHPATEDTELSAVQGKAEASIQGTLQTR